MAVAMQKTKQTIMARCHLQLDRQRYSMAEKIIGFELYY